MRRAAIALTIVAAAHGYVHAQDTSSIAHEGIVEAPLERDATTLRQLQEHFASR